MCSVSGLMATKCATSAAVGTGTQERITVTATEPPRWVGQRRSAEDGVGWLTVPVNSCSQIADRLDTRRGVQREYLSEEPVSARKWVPGRMKAFPGVRRIANLTYAWSRIKDAPDGPKGGSLGIAIDCPTICAQRGFSGGCVDRGGQAEWGRILLRVNNMDIVICSFYL
jgi:hypothetical protein